MKRTAFGVLCLLIALPVLAGSPGAYKMRFTMKRCVSLEHTPSGWRMQVTCREGNGVIVLADAAGTRNYRGTGVFAKSSQKELDATYQSLIPRDDSRFELPQLG
jgi:hypothetical protein